MKKYIILSSTLLCFGCNTINIKPNTLDTTQPIYSETNGEGILHYFKDELENRGYNITVGTKTNVFDSPSILDNMTKNTTLNQSTISTTDIRNARYVAHINEYNIGPYMLVLGRPLCMFNGWKWVDFSISIADNKTGKEIMNWSGMGCKNYAIDQLKEYLDILEKK